jgi:cobalt-zinc-cadmium efflux system membrane fusion protein
VDGDHTVYTVGDLSTVWLALAVPPADAGRLRVGEAVVVDGVEGAEAVTGRLVTVSPLGSERTQTLVARGELPNPDGRLRPGLFATAEVVVEEAEVPVAVRPEALQTFRDWDVVYLTDGRVFQAMPVEIGRRDREWVEIRSGVEAGQRYAGRGSFVVKADVGKSGATHEH